MFELHHLTAQEQWDWLHRGEITPTELAEHYLDRIDGAPLTVVVGEDDTLVPPPALSATVARRTSATVVVVDGCGHLLPPERWEQVLRVLPA